MTKQALIDTQHKLAESFPVLGYACWWSINGVSISRDVLADLFQQVGLNEAWLPAEKKPRSAFHRALKKIQGGKEGKKYVIRQIDDLAEQVIYGVVEAKADKEAEELLFNPKNKIRFHKLHGEVSTDDNRYYPNGRLEKEFDHFLRFYDSHDVRMMLLEIVNTHLQSVNIREKGGVYFIVAEHGAEVMKLHELAALLPGNCAFEYLPIIESQQTKETMLRTFMNEAGKEMETLRDEMKLYLGKGDTRPSTLRNKLDEFKSMKAKLELFSTALQYNSEKLQSELSEWEKGISDYFVKHSLS